MRITCTTCITGIVLAMAARAAADEPAPNVASAPAPAEQIKLTEVPLDVGKGRIETPVKGLIGAPGIPGGLIPRPPNGPSLSAPKSAAVDAWSMPQVGTASDEPSAAEGAGNASTEPPASLDPGKAFIEAPVKQVVQEKASTPHPISPGSEQTPNAPRKDLAKYAIEIPSKQLLSSGAAQAESPQAPDETPRDLEKRRIQRPVKQLVGASAARKGAAPNAPPEPSRPARSQEPREKPDEPGDIAKSLFIEAPVERVVATETTPEPTSETAPERKSAAPQTSSPTNVQLDEQIVDNASDDNPEVEPGKVKWHEDYAAACQAAKQSGKPVLLFHLMGQLDQRFT